jgi:hypothetical protein
MAGYWLDCSGGREASETWSDPRGGRMVGHALSVRGEDVSFETSSIGPYGDGLAYFARPGGGDLTVFPLAERSEGRAVFENPQNDFPTRVIYHRIGEVMTARIEGQIDGQPRAMEWRFQKAELNARCA